MAQKDRKIILIISNEEEKQVGAILYRLLEEHYIPILVLDIDKDFNFVQTIKPDLLIIDNINTRDGIDLYTKLPREKVTNIPAIIIGKKFDFEQKKDDMIKYRLLQLEKPFTTEDFFKIIENAFSEKQK